jgi:hypothetical protein
MKTQGMVRGYCVRGKDDMLGTFFTGLERTSTQARKTYYQMMQSCDYTKTEKESLVVVRIREIYEEV